MTRWTWAFALAAPVALLQTLAFAEGRDAALVGELVAATLFYALIAYVLLSIGAWVVEKARGEES